MSDKLYVGVLNFKSNTLSEAGQELQKYLDLGLNPIITNEDIIMSVLDYTKTLPCPTEYIDVLSIYDFEGNEISGWYVEIERRIDNIVQGKLVGRGIGCIRFIQSPINLKFESSGVVSANTLSRDTLLRMSKRLEIVL